MKKFDKSTRSLIHPDGSTYLIYGGKISKCVIVCTAVYYMEYGEKEKSEKMLKL